MGALRVTQRILVDRLLNNVNFQQRQILRLQEQLATGQRVNTPSDDPLAARRGINVRSEIERNEQFLTNISVVSPFMRATETATLSAVDLVQRLNQLTLQANNNIGATQRENLATEINEVLEGFLVESNTVNNGRYIFSGTRTNTVPFEAQRGADGEITAVTYRGNNRRFQVEISTGTFVNVNEPGSAVFQGSDDIFDLAIAIRDGARSGADLTGELDRLNQIRGQFLESIARLGATQGRVERVASNLDEVNLQLTEVYTNNIDADFADVTLNLNVQLSALQAALNAGARVIQPSLLDFVR